MEYCSYSPGPPLGKFIERFWHCSDAPPHPRERILPNGMIELVINLRDDEIRIYDPTPDGRCRRFSGAVLSGTYSRSFVIDPQVHASILGVHFRPGGAFPFLGIPIGELADTHLDLETVWGPAARELQERLCEASTPAARFSLLEAALLARWRGAPRRHGAVAIALEAFEWPGDEVRICELSRRVGLSQRRFIQVFTAEVGLTPKRYSRVRRFQRTLERVKHTPFPDWARVAADCGYYDQSHLIHDFHAFSGFRPADFQRQRSEQLLPNHVHEPR